MIKLHNADCIERILDALQDAEMHLNTQNGMVMFDAVAPDKTIVIDNSIIVAKLNSVIELFVDG
jgi:hypothetical protein